MWSAKQHWSDQPRMLFTCWTVKIFLLLKFILFLVNLCACVACCAHTTATLPLCAFSLQASWHRLLGGEKRWCCTPLNLLVMCTANYHGPTCFTNLNPLLAKAGMGEEAVFFLHLERLRSSCPQVHCKEAKECYHVMFLWVRNRQPPKNIGSE